MVAAPVTPKVEDKVAALATDKVESIEAAPVTSRAPLRVASPVTPKVEASEVAPEMLVVPDTSKLALALMLGLPIPTWLFTAAKKVCVVLLLETPNSPSAKDIAAELFAPGTKVNGVIADV